MFKKVQNLSNVKIIALSFLVIILLGTFLLLLPISSCDHSSCSFVDALFTATSATCVTGLVVFDTGTHWSIFGQIVILLMIQIGGLGFITIGVFFASFLRKKINLKQRNLIQDSVSSLHLQGSVKLVIKTIKRTFMIELIGAVILTIEFLKDYDFIHAIYFGIFHSISAFCNAGFDLLGFIEPYGSLVPYKSDLVINFTIMSLIVIGGLGFIVWDDLSEKKFHIHSYLLQTKVVLITTFTLIIAGTLGIYALERTNSLSSYSTDQALLISMFQSITCRTAGFNTFDITQFTSGSRLIMMLLMFIGGSPGSTAGGIKTTTFLVLIILVISNIQNKKNCNIFNRRFEEDGIKKACTVFFINLFFLITGIMLLMIFQEKLGLEEVMYEVFSALGTVGISMGITRSLNIASKLVIVLLMYSGRVGTVTFTLLITGNKKELHIMNPVEKIAIG